ncbi:MAG: stress-induced protein [Flavisolibacter sp.]|jgi:general stress protein YciG|nr:stress-induced protein [Flavisolibacter sp.]
MTERGQSEQSNRFGQNKPPQGEEASRTNNDLSENEQGESSDRKGTANRGFAAMNSEKQKKIASEGGRAAHRQGVAHEWSKDEAREAGRKGGQIVSRNREHMSEIGRKGGQSSGQKRQKSDTERS